jgi:glycosyltransferase involved in cell wall biosynthesis
LGRVQPNKGVGRVLDAWESVHPRTGGRLVIVGDGPGRAELESRNLPGVDWRGRVSDDEKRELLGSAWLLVHGAYREGWGIVIIEAAAQRTPTVAFDVPGVRDAIVDGETGELVGSVAALAERWVALSGDRARLEAMGEAARARASLFTWSASTDEFLEATAAAIERASTTWRGSGSVS